MVQQDERPTFDIQTTGAALIDRAVAQTRSKKQELSFAAIAQCAHRYEASRVFTALLQSANDGALEIVRPAQARPDTTAPFTVRVL